MKQKDLFSIDEIIDDTKQNEEVVDNEIVYTFPIYVRDNTSTRFTFYKNEKQFEEITISKHNESFRGSLLFGFNEQLHDFKYDTKLFIDALLRAHVLIEQNEYDEMFARLINGREEFFNNEIESQYIERELSEKQKTIKHKWRAPEL